jgi:hypothetical protein
VVLRAESRAEGRLICRLRPITGGERGQSGVDSGAGRQAIPLAGSLIAAEEEQLVLLNRAAERAAELVLLQNLLAASAQRILEKAVGVEIFVAEELEQGSVKAIGAGLGDQIDVRARIAAITGVKR